MKLSLTATKQFLNPQTHYVHYYYHGEPPYYTAPVYENLCAILALFKTREKEEVEKGIEWLSRILHFQNADGFFPVYIHEYPAVKDHMAGVYHLKPLMQIEEQFKTVIPYRDNLKKAINRLKEATKNFYLEKKPQGFIAYQLYQLMPEIGPVPLDFPRWMGSTHLAERLLQNEGEEWLKIVWHTPSQNYVGPSFRERQEGYAPEITNLHLILGIAPKVLSPHHIQASLFNRTIEPPSFKDFDLEEETDGYRWAVRHREKYAFSVMDKKEPSPLYNQPGCQLFRLIAGDHSWVLEGSEVDQCRFEMRENGVDLYLVLPKTVDLDDREKQRELTFYCDDKMEVIPEKGKSTLFYMDETLLFKTEDQTFKLRLSVETGKGDFAGHLIKENRPSQIIKTHVFDRGVALRTLRRDADLVIKASITL